MSGVNDVISVVIIVVMIIVVVLRFLVVGENVLICSS